MATSVDITNLALSHLGNKANVAAISPPDGTVEAGWASRFFNLAVYRALARQDWSFARKRIALSTVDLPTSSAWRYGYAKPSDCIAPRRILTGDTSQYEDDSEPFQLEGEVICTNKAEAVLVYTQPILDATKFTAGFVDVISYDLAAYLAGPILKGNEGVNAARKLLELAAAMSAVAAATDGETTGSRPENQYVPASTRARGGGRAGAPYGYTGVLPSGFEVL